MYIAYYRISTKNQSNGYSLDNQKTIIRKYANNNNITITNEYYDIGSAYKKMKNLVSLNKIINEHNDSTLLVVNIDRFSRNLEEGIIYLKKLEQKNIRLYSIEQNVCSDNISGIRLIKGFINDSEFESNTTGIRVKKSLNEIKSRGGYIGIPRYGFKKSKLNKIPILVKCNYEQKIIKLISDLRIGITNSDIINKQISIILNQKKINKLNFYDRDNNIIDVFDKPFTLTFSEITTILNDYNFKYRKNKRFKVSSVTNIFKKNNKLKDIKKIKNINFNINSQFKNLKI